MDEFQNKTLGCALFGRTHRLKHGSEIFIFFLVSGTQNRKEPTEQYSTE